jgi:sugar phosphate isomerase/epimerase/catechol 2,3-dioxygenase-like lactoylglutathione lyase family enzyme
VPTLVQLYSVRKSSSLEVALDQIAAAGYHGVEGYMQNFDNPGALRAALDDRQLAMPQAHFPLALLEDHFEHVLHLCKTLGVHTVVVPGLPESDRPTTAQGWRRLATRLDAIEAKLRRVSLRLAWHNHEFELEPMAGGNTPMDIMLRFAPGMDWEIDLGWILRADHDPVRWLRTYASRIISVHIKDIRHDLGEAAEGGWADLGFGKTNWIPVFDVLKRLPRLATYVAEHDEPADFGRFVGRWKMAYDRLSSIQTEQLFEGFTHVALKVRDLNKQLAFYAGVLGFGEMFRLHSDDGKLFLVYLRINDRQYLELFPDAIGDETPTPNARGYQHICLDVSDLDETVDKLLSRGARMCLWHEDLSGIFEVDGSAVTMGRDGNRQSWLKDPEGNRIELMELALGGMQYLAMEERLKV